jgi:hypothetical protein
VPHSVIECVCKAAPEKSAIATMMILRKWKERSERSWKTK